MAAYPNHGMHRFASFDGVGIAYTIVGEGPDALLLGSIVDFVTGVAVAS